MPARVKETGLNLIGLEIPPDAHWRLRAESAIEGLRMAAMARKLIDDRTAARKAGSK